MGSAIGVILVVVAIGALIIFARRESAPDDALMPEASRRFLAAYLLSLAIALVYLVVALFSVRFPDTQITQSPAPVFADTDRPKDERLPVIRQVDPSALVVDAVQPELRIYGYHFAPKSTVRFDGKPRTFTYIGEHLIIVPLDSADFSRPGSVALGVQTDDGVSDPWTVQILSSTGDLRVLWGTFAISREVHLLLLVLVAGSLGSYVHAIRSLADYIGNRKLVASWFWFYVTKPFIGMPLALMFYSAIRGGFVAGSPADVKSVNPFGVFAIAAMVGMFVDKAGDKLADIFDALFKATAAENRDDKLTDVTIETKSLPDATATRAYGPVQLAASGGKKPYAWSATGLPEGLSIDPETGLLSGTPTAAQEARSVTVTVTDGSGAEATRTLTLTVH